MNQTMFSLIAVICLIVVAAAGCVGNTPGNNGTVAPSPSETPVLVGHLVVNESQNNATVYVNQGNIITVRLAENPTTGFQWNLSTTSGLSVTGTISEPSDKTGKLVGSGGTPIWDITADAKGEQRITAAYRRSWEPVTGNETAFVLTLIVS